MKFRVNVGQTIRSLYWHSAQKKQLKTSQHIYLIPDSVR